MGNFEKLSVLVIVVIIVMILVVALYTWQDNGDESTTLNAPEGGAGPASARLENHNLSILVNSFNAYLGIITLYIRRFGV